MSTSMTIALIAGFVLAVISFVILNFFFNQVI